MSSTKSYNNSRELFPNVEIKGGICYYLENLSYQGKCHYTLINGDNIQSDSIALNAFDVLIREPKVAKIVSIVTSTDYDKVESIISADTPFGIPTNPTNNKKVIIDVVEEPDEKHTIKLYYLKNLKRVTGYITKDVITKNVSDVDKYKVFVPGAGGSGTDTKILGDPIVATPGSVCSQTYLYSAFATEEEAKAFAKYLRTRFLRFLVSSIKITQHAQSGVYRYVPIQDFKSNEDIDWTKSIDEIDTQLFDKYGLTNGEVAYIKSIITPM